MKIANFSQLSLCITAVCCCLANNIAVAQVAEDNTLSTEVKTENNRDFTVDAGEQRGNNLFHSFQEFSIPNSGSVVFNNPTTIQNIISRVTGSSISNIDGLIKSAGNANLFLINPNGIIFGKNARLNIGGSFIGTTAESLVFEDGSEFSTNPDNLNSLLTVSVPLGLQFGRNPGEIINQADFLTPNPFDPTGVSQIKVGLTTSPGKTLALLGNNITFDGGAVFAPRGNIELGSVAENSFVSLNPHAKGWDVSYKNVEQFRDLKFDNLASVNGSGEGGGDIDVWGRNIRIRTGSEITSSTTGDIDGGTIQIHASELLEINGSDRTNSKLDPSLTQFELFFPFSSQVTSNTFGSGKGGDISIITNDLNLIDGGTIELQTFANGRGGNLFIVANGTINSRGVRPFFGNGENTTALIDPAFDLNTAIEINQSSQILVLSTNIANGGDIDIATKNLRLEDGTGIATSPLGTGDGGNIDIRASESIEIIGTSPRTGIISSGVATNTFNNGNAGNIDIDTKKLTVVNGGAILSATNTNLDSFGNAGNINIAASSIEISGVRANNQFPSLISTQTDNGGNGGNIFLNTDRLSIINGASLSVEASGVGVPGELVVNANSVNLKNRGSIVAETEFGTGGNIELNVRDTLRLENNSLISAKASGDADGGNVAIDTEFVVASPEGNNDILANAFRGDGGNITIAASSIFGLSEGKSKPPNSNNDLDASSEFGLSGTVNLLVPNSDSDTALVKNPTQELDANSYFKNNFCRKVSQNDSEYIITGKGGLAILPDRDRETTATWTDWRIVDSPAQQTKEPRQQQDYSRMETKPTPLTPIQGWLVDRQGKVILTAEALFVTPHPISANAPNCHS